MNLSVASVSGWKEKAKSLVLPGFDGVPISHVAAFVIKGFTKGVLVTRASSIAFNLLIALLPASIFLFTLIPFIPLPNFQEEIIRLFESFLPADAYGFLESTIVDVVTNKSGSLLLIMFIATVVFSTNGIHAIIHAFIVSAHNFRSRSWVNQRKISVVLLGLVLFLISVAGSLVIFGKIAVNKPIYKEKIITHLKNLNYGRHSNLIEMDIQNTLKKITQPTT